jgi:hypothetical protein
MEGSFCSVRICLFLPIEYLKVFDLMKTPKEIDKIALIEIQEGSILSTRSKGKTKFYIPGGKREKGESD